MFKRFKVGLALGGGAARGLAHIGVIEVFKEHNIPVDIITGTSIGAVIGGMYAVEPDVDKLKEKIYAYFESDAFKKARFDFLKERDTEEGEGIFFRFSHFIQKGIFYTLSITKKSFISEKTFSNNIACVLDDINIEDAEKPFAATSVDLNSGEEHVLRSGPLRKAVEAGCALPGIMPPVVVGDKCLIDGGWIDAVPVKPAFLLGADVVIGVDVGRDINAFYEPKNALDIAFRADTVTRYALSKETIKEADFVIKLDVGAIHWADFKRIDECIEKGKEQTLPHIKDIKSIIRSKRIKGFFRGVF